MSKISKSLDGRIGPWEVNRFECGCVIASEFTNGSGIKTINYCCVHKAGPELLEACKQALRSSEDDHGGGWRWLNDVLRDAIAKAEAE